MGTYSGKLTQTIACSHPFHTQNYTAGPLTPKHTVLHLIRLDTVYTAKQYCYLRELRLILYRLSNFTYLHSLFLSYPYTRNTMKYNQYKHAGHTSAMPTVTQYNVKIHEKTTRLIIIVRKTRIKRSRSIATK